MIYCYFTLCQFFTPALDGTLSQELDWQQVSSGMQNMFPQSALSNFKYV